MWGRNVSSERGDTVAPVMEVEVVQYLSWGETGKRVLERETEDV